MKKLTLPENFREEEVNQLIELATSNVELFRHKTAEAYKAFGATQRQWLKDLESSRSGAIDFYKSYELRFKPLVNELQKEFTAPSFTRSLRKSLQLEEPEAEKLKQKLIHERNR